MCCPDDLASGRQNCSWADKHYVEMVILSPTTAIYRSYHCCLWVDLAVQEIPVVATAGSHVFPWPMRHRRRLLSSLQHMRPISSRLCRLLVRLSMHFRGAVLPQVPDVQDARQWRHQRRRMGTVRWRLATLHRIFSQSAHKRLQLARKRYTK